jgi:signal transduction histidine kinase
VLVLKNQELMKAQAKSKLFLNMVIHDLKHPVEAIIS